MREFLPTFQCDGCRKQYDGRKQATDPKAEQSLCKHCYEDLTVDESEDKEEDDEPTNTGKIVTHQTDEEDGWTKKNDPRFGNHP
jgi:predicted sulfurtransferase